MKSWAWEEMNGTTLLDVRARSSLAEICEDVHAAPGVAFSVAAGHAGRQVFQRVSEVQGVDTDALLRGHFDQTAARCGQYPLVLVAQDTTKISFTRNLPVAGSKSLRQRRLVRQYLAHSALALSPAGLPLGMLHLRLWERQTKTAAGGSLSVGEKQKRRRSLPTGQKESQKWLAGLRDVEARLPETQPVLLIQDREADVFAFLAAPRRAHTQLLVRAAQDRNVAASAGATLPTVSTATTNLRDAAATLPVQSTRTVVVPAAVPGTDRTAELTVRFGSLWLLPPTHGHREDPQQPQRVWVVVAEELAAPAGESPIRWVLLTTKPVEDGETAAEMLDYYALRWRIERLHYTLKSGLDVGRLQHDEVRLPLALALYYLVGWRILWCLYLGRHEPERPANQVLDPEEIRVLTAATRQPVQNAADVVKALARLGGYVSYRSAKPPGLKRIWQGYHRLEILLIGTHLLLE